MTKSIKICLNLNQTKPPLFVYKKLQFTIYNFSSYGQQKEIRNLVPLLLLPIKMPRKGQRQQWTHFLSTPCVVYKFINTYMYVCLAYHLLCFQNCTNMLEDKETRTGCYVTNIKRTKTWPELCDNSHDIR